MAEQKIGFFQKLFGKKDVVPPVEEKVIDIASVPTVATVIPQTLLSLTEEQQESLSENEIEVVQKFLSKLPPLDVGKFDFHAFEAGSLNGGYYAKVIIRNGMDLENDFTLVEIPLSLYDASGDKIAESKFKLENFGSLKFGESRLWTFIWEPSQCLKQFPDLSSFSVTF